MLIANYGNGEKAQISINKLKQDNPNEESFNAAFEKELNIELINERFSRLLEIDSLPGFVEYLHDIDSGKMMFDKSNEDALQGWCMEKE